MGCGSDKGTPVVRSDPQGEPARHFTRIAENLAVQVSAQEKSAGGRPVPVQISPPGGPSIEIQWSDGRASTFKPRELRAACPCAACVDEFTGRRLLDPARVPDDIRALAVNPVGHYAIQVVWSDRHNTGLYGFEYLRKLSLST